MRLIDADALRAEIEKYLELNQETMLYDDDVINMIDNAPTVEAIPNKEGYEMYNKGYMSGYESGKKARPTGEWKEHDFKTFGGLGDWDYKCSNCEKVYCGKSNYCPYCGARMKGAEK